MKQVIRPILFSSFLLPASLLAKPGAEAYVASYAGRADVPVPVSVVTPEIGAGHEGTEVRLTFVIEADGTPRDIYAPVDADRRLVRQLADAVAQWRFKPLTRDGEVVRARVTLPFRIGARREAVPANEG